MSMRHERATRTHWTKMLHEVLREHSMKINININIKIKMNLKMKTNVKCKNKHRHGHSQGRGHGHGHGHVSPPFVSLCFISLRFLAFFGFVSFLFLILKSAVML
jgi:hypothetical protein